MSTLFIQAMNVHIGGGASLLRSLLTSIPLERTVVVLLDKRMLLPDNLPDNLIIKRVHPTLKSRWQAERWLGRATSEGDIVLCFGNLPPLRPLKAQVLVFVQNRFLIDNVSLRTFPVKTRLRLWIERRWLSYFARNGNFFVVQTPSMQRLLALQLQLPELDVQLWPFADVENTDVLASEEGTLDASWQSGNLVDFIYPASGDPYKNHKKLIEAWAILAGRGIYPSLHVTLDQSYYPELCSLIKSETKRLGLKIVNLGFLSHEDLLKQYRRVKALIYPSLLESFGLPLMEAKEARIAILAAELDYVRDIVDPVQVFDPLSPLSIARAVQRFLGKPENGLALLGADIFLERVLATGTLQQSSDKADINF